MFGHFPQNDEPADGGAHPWNPAAPGPLVSVVIPAYNQGRYVAAAVESVLAQTYPHVEVIVVDDGSTDDTAAVLARLAAGPRVRVFRQPNAGVGRARNRGVAEARGSLICFLDADDMYVPEKIARQVAQFERDPDLGMVYCDVVPMDVNGTVTGGPLVKGSREVLSGDILPSLLTGGYFPPHTMMVRRSVCGDDPFDPDLGGHADLDLWLRLAGNGVRAEFLSEPLALYRSHEGGMSRDLDHMSATREAALVKAARRHPEQVGLALSRLQDTNRELHVASQWLRAELDRWLAIGRAETSSGVFDCLAHLAVAERVDGRRDDVARWEVTIEGASTYALFLHPPAAVRFDVGLTGPGKVSGAMALHPDVWERADSGPCRFDLRVDEAFVSRVIDPRVASHRRWLPFEIAVPAARRPHIIEIHTEGIEGHAHRWALWQALRFTAVGEGAGD